MYTTSKVLRATSLTAHAYLRRNITEHLSCLLKHTFTTQKVMLDPIEQRAFVSATVIKIISQYNQYSFERQAKSIRELICDRVYFNKFLAEQVKKSSSLVINKIEDFKIQEKYVQEVIGAFQIHKGGYFDSIVWQQKRFSQANPLSNSQNTSLDSGLSKGRLLLVLNPQIYTKDIFREIISSKQNSIVSGQKGIGKSFSYLIYAYLSNFIVQYKLWCIKNSRAPSQQIYFIINQPTFESIGKLIYFNLGKNKLGINVVKSLVHQIPQLDWSFIQWSKASQADYVLNFLDEYLNKIIIHFQTTLTPNIPLRLIIDEANYYFSQCRENIPNLQKRKILFPQFKQNPAQFFKRQRITQDDRKIYQNLEEGNGTSIKDIKYYVDKTIKNLNSEESLVFNSLFLRSINSCYPSLRMILNSSQQIQDKFIVNWNSFTPNNLLYCFNTGLSGQENNLKVYYTKQMNEKYFQIQIYYLFWFQIENHLNKVLQQKRYRDLTQQTKFQIIKKIKIIFKLTFCLPTPKEQLNIQGNLQSQNINKLSKPLINWKLDVRNLQIRRCCRQSSFYSWIQIAQRNMENKQIQQLTHLITNLKQKIEEKRFQAMKQRGFELYVQIKGSPTEKKYRQVLISIIHQFAVSSLRKAISNKKYIQNFQMSFKVVSTNKPNKLTQLIEELPSFLNFGYIQQIKDQKFLKFIMKPSQVIELTDFINKYSLQNYAAMFALLSHHGFHEALTGNIMDKFYYEAFRSRNFSMTFTQYESSHKKIYYTQNKAIVIEDTLILPIVASDKFSFQIHFKQLIQKAQQNPLKSYGGFPALKLNQNFKSQYELQQEYLFSNKYSQSPIYQNIIYQSNNPTFDAAIVTNTFTELKIILIDLAMGKINEKLSQRYRLQLLLLKYLKEFSSTKKIIIQFMFMCPNHHIQEYFRSAKQTKEFFQNEKTADEINKQIDQLKLKIKNQLSEKKQAEMRKKLEFLSEKVKFIKDFNSNKQLRKYVSGISSDKPNQFIALSDPQYSNRQISMNGFIERVFKQMKQRERALEYINKRK